MTFSIVARSGDGTMHGVAVASKFPAVGGAVPAARADVGTLATQSYANLAYRAQGLTLLGTGVQPQDVLAGLIAADPASACTAQRKRSRVPSADSSSASGTTPADA